MMMMTGTIAIMMMMMTKTIATMMMDWFCFRFHRGEQLSVSICITSQPKACNPLSLISLVFLFVYNT